MAKKSDPRNAGLRPRGKAECLPSEGPSARQLLSDSSEGRHSAFPRGRKPAQWQGASAGVAPASANHRTHLPHVEAGEVPQHVCFRLSDSLPRSVRDQLTATPSRHDVASANAAWRRQVHVALDSGYGACWLRRPNVAVVVRDAFLHFHEERYLLHEWVIMPNHVHTLLTPLLGTPLSSIVHSWKSHTARRVNSILARRGRVWARDYFDRTIRNDEHFRITADYIRANPANAGLCDVPEDWRWSSAYEPSVRDAAPVWLVSRPPLQARPIRPRQTMRPLHAS